MQTLGLLALPVVLAAQVVCTIVVEWLSTDRAHCVLGLKEIKTVTSVLHLRAELAGLRVDNLRLGAKA